MRIKSINYFYKSVIIQSYVLFIHVTFRPISDLIILFGGLNRFGIISFTLETPWEVHLHFIALLDTRN